MAETFRYFVDSNVLIGHIRQKSGVTLLERALDAYGVPSVSAIVVYEVNFGGYRVQRPNEFDANFGLFEVVIVDDVIADRAAELHATLVGQNQNIGFYDTVVAATALVYGLPLLTTNLKHFERVPGLDLLPLPPRQLG